MFRPNLSHQFWGHYIIHRITTQKVNLSLEQLDSLSFYWKLSKSYVFL